MVARNKTVAKAPYKLGRSEGAASKKRVSLADSGVRSVGVCGVGLIGGSMAERLRSTFGSLRVIGHDRRKVLDVALEEGVIESEAKLTVMLAECDLIVLSANPASNKIFLKILSKQAVESSALVIDTGSTQCGIAEFSKTLDWKNKATFIAGHPMAGREVQGIESRQVGLFEGHPFFFDDSVKLSAKQKRIVDWFTGALGAFALYVENGNHDAVMTDISQIPQLLSTIMSGFVSHHDKRTIHLAGTGLQSMIRLGGSPYSNWRDVFDENSEGLCTRLDALIVELQSVRKQISAGESLQDSFKKAKRSYSCLW